MSKKMREKKPKWSKWELADVYEPRKGFVRERKYETKNFQVTQRQEKKGGFGNDFSLSTSTFYSEKRK